MDDNMIPEEVINKFQGKMIKFTDAEGNKIYVRRDDVRAIIIGSPLVPKSVNIIRMAASTAGLQSVVTVKEAMHVLEQLGESPLLH